MDGILIIDKPEGFTSFDVVAKMRGMLRTRKVGHAGTLDPMATGVLPILVERGTKCCDILPCQDKRYTATMKLGVLTDTLDSTGTVLETRPVSVTKERVEEVLRDFVGEIMQVPPMYSAIQINGQRLYDLARQGIEVEREARPITIYHCNLLGEGPEENEYIIDVACSKGTYIRTLCGDIGEKLGCGACMEALRRVQAGEYTIEESVPLLELLEMENPETVLRQVDTMFRNYPAVTLSEKQKQRFLHGNSFSVKLEPGTYRAYGPEGDFLMLAKVEDGIMSTIKSFFEVE